MTRITMTSRPRAYVRGDAARSALEGDLHRGLVERQWAVRQVAVAESEATPGWGQYAATVIIQHVAPISDSRQNLILDLDALLIQAGEQAIEAVVEDWVDQTVTGAVLGAAGGGGATGLGTRRFEAGLLGALAGALAGGVVGALFRRWVPVLLATKGVNGLWMYSLPGAGQGRPEQASS